jgi:hypothetical protein
VYAERSGRVDPHAQSAKLTSDEPSGTELALPAVLAQPFHGTRGTTPGPLGCWAVKRDGQPCRAAQIKGSDFCSAHSGLGIASDPSGHSPRGVKASAESRRRRAELRLVIGRTRPSSPRSALKALANVNAERLAGRAVSAALDPEVRPDTAAKLALEIIEATDPKDQATLTVSGSIDPSTATLSELMSFAEAHGISLSEGANGSVEPSPALGVGEGAAPEGHPLEARDVGASLTPEQ